MQKNFQCIGEPWCKNDHFICPLENFGPLGKKISMVGLSFVPVPEENLQMEACFMALIKWITDLACLNGIFQSTTKCSSYVRERSLPVIHNKIIYRWISLERYKILRGKFLQNTG